MAKFLAEYEMPDEARDMLEKAWGRISAPQSKQKLWDLDLHKYPGLGPSLQAALQKRDIVGCWIVSRTPHPSPPVAILDMAVTLKCIAPQDAADVKAMLPKSVFTPFQVPAGQEI